METIKRFKTFILGEDFFTGNLYLFVLALATLVAWYCENMIIAFAIYGVAIVCMALFSKSLIGVMPILCFATMSCGTKIEEDIEMLTPIIVAGVILVVAVLAAAIIFFIKNKVKLRPRVPLWGFAAVLIAAVFGGVGVGYFKEFTVQWLGGIGASAGMLIAAWLLSCTIKEADPKFVAKVFIFMSFIVVMETVGYFYGMSSKELEFALLHKTLDYGWNVSNAGAVVMLTGIPASFYLISRKGSRPYLPMLYVMVLITAIAFTQSRTAELVALVITPICFLVAFVVSDKKIEIVESVLIIFICLCIVYLGLKDSVNDLLERWMSMGIKGNGRIELWTTVWNDIKAGQYAFGYGFLRHIPNSRQVMTHNMFLQFWYNFGIVGLVASVPYYFFIYKTLFYKTGISGFFIAMSILATDMFGCLDLSLFTPYCMMPMLCAMVMAKNLREAREDEKFRAIAVKAREVELAAQAPSAVFIKSTSASIDDIDDDGIPKINLF